MSAETLLVSVTVMALVTYLPRVLPLAVFRQKIKNPFVRSFLLYMPYGILAAMVFPAVFYSTSCVLSAAAGALISFFLAWKKHGLLTVAIGGTLAVLLTEWLLTLF